MPEFAAVASPTRRNDMPAITAQHQSAASTISGGEVMSDLSPYTGGSLVSRGAAV
jgi:hypothetical protein